MPASSIEQRRVPPRRLATQPIDAELARWAKALGHPARIRILRLLAGQQRCFYGPLADELPLAASTVSQHLRILRDAGLVQGEVAGPRTCYCLDRDALARAAVLLQGLVATRPDEGPATMRPDGPACQRRGLR